MSSEVPAPIGQLSSEISLTLLVELPSWPRVFFGNLWDLIGSRENVALDLRSAPAPFWPDVFVSSRLPWLRFLESVAFHAIALGLTWAASHFLIFEPRSVARAEGTHVDVIYYTPEEYLPPLDTRQPESAKTQKADPEYSAQPIISVPREADNREQTIVTPPDIRLK